MKFSVLISVYQKENPIFFSDALTSIVKQTLLPSEIVLIKDGILSKELYSIIDKFNVQYPGLFKIISIEKNQGLGNALRTGVLECKYDWIARMDTDDISLPTRFEKQVNFLKLNPEIDVLGTNVEEFNKNPGDLGYYRLMPEGGKKLEKFAKLRSPVNHPTIFIRKSAILAVGNYENEILQLEDFVLFIKMLSKNYKFHNLQEILLYFRVGNGLDTIKRRSGYKYIKNELKFLRFAYNIKHLTIHQVAIYLFTRIPLRILPPKLLMLVYNSFLRKSSKK